MSDLSQTEKSESILQNINLILIGVKNQRVLNFSYSAKVTEINSAEELPLQNQNLTEKYCSVSIPDFIVFDSIKKSEIEKIRENDLFVSVPILIIQNDFEDKSLFDEISETPRLLVCNTCVVNSEVFQKHLLALAEKKKKILSSRTGVIVKYTIFFINTGIQKQLTRGKLAEKAGVTEDYLTRIFHEEMGVPLWDYLNLIRMDSAKKLLLQTDDSIYLIAEKSGFPDAAYFNRVFHKQFGMTPGAFRKAGIPS